MSKLIKLRLTEDLEKKAREMAGERRLDLFIMDALREKCFPEPREIIELKGEIAAALPIIGSIPAPRERHG